MANVHLFGFLKAFFPCVVKYLIKFNASENRYSFKKSNGAALPRRRLSLKAGQKLYQKILEKKEFAYHTFSIRNSGSSSGDVVRKLNVRGKCRG